MQVNGSDYIHSKFWVRGELKMRFYPIFLRRYAYFSAAKVDDLYVVHKSHTDFLRKYAFFPLVRNTTYLKNI